MGYLILFAFILVVLFVGLKALEAHEKEKVRELKKKQRQYQAASKTTTTSKPTTKPSSASRSAPKPTRRYYYPMIPADTWDNYVSPSGGFIDYGTFQVEGLFPETNRRRKRTYKVRDEAAAMKAAESDGLTEPFSVTVLPSRAPTDRQLEYAHSVNIPIPEGACFDDVSAMLTRFENDEFEYVDTYLAREAFNHGIKISRYSCTEEILNKAKLCLSADEYKELVLTLEA